MISSKILTRLLVPAATVIAEAKLQSHVNETNNLCRASELPIYTNEPVLVKSNVVETSEVSNFLEDSIRTVRQTVTKYSDEIKAYERVGVEYLKESRDNVEWLVGYLREENNTTPKAGAIGIGALTGLIFGLRGGLIKKTIYATTGALGMGAVCYPKEAAQYSQVALVETKKYLTIAYNFAYGVKKGDPSLELPSLPKLPSLPEAWGSVKQSAMSLVSDESSAPVAEKAKVQGAK